MKKIISLALVVVMTMTVLSACSGNKYTEDGTVEEGKLIMGTNAAFPPYEYRDGDKVIGIDAEIAEAIAGKLGLELVIEDMDFDAIITAVSSGKVDMGMAGMTVTDKRKKSVNFSDTYATGVQVIIVSNDSKVSSVDDLFTEGKDVVVGVQTGTTGDIYCSDLEANKGISSVERYNKGADAVLALSSGKVDCVVIDNEPAKNFVAANEGLSILNTQYAVEDYAIAIAKDNDVLTEKVNGALKELIDDGTVQSIIDKYITAE